MLTIKIEENEWLGCEWLVGFTEDHTSFLHLRDEDFVNAKKIGTLEQVDQITKRWICQGLSLGQFKLSEPLVIVTGDIIERIIIRRIGLDHDTAGSIAAPCPAGNLAKQREYTLSAAKVWQI